MTLNLAELSTAKVNDVTFDVELEHPIAGATGMVVRVIGLHSEKVRALRDAQANEMLKQNFEAQRKGKAVSMTVEGSSKRNAKLLAHATVGWFTKEGGDKPGSKAKFEEGFPWDDGRLMFSTEEAEKLYADPTYDWLTKQVDEAVAELANFMKA